MALSRMFRFVRSEFSGLIKRPAFLMFLFLLSMVMMFQLTYNADKLNSPMTSLVSTPLLFSNIMTSLFLAYLASAAFAREFEHRTLNILLTTPLTRTEIYLGKMLSLFCLIPIMTVFNSLYIYSLTASYGLLPDAVGNLVPYELGLSALFFACVISLTMLISIFMRKSSMVLIIMVVLTLISAFIGLPAVMTSPYGYSVNYGFVSFLPASTMVAGMLVANSYFVAEGGLVPLQLVFLLVTVMLGVVLFRRSELWG
jgi:ABC-type transport system involved in multi-copper enzyme maturation permease subunit